MVDYIAPESTKIPFKFGTSGYIAPDFADVNFVFSTSLAQETLNAAITGVEVFQQPKDYLKSCDTQVLGYTSGAVQIIRSRCIYGGVRDLSTILRAINLRDLPAYIIVGYQGHDDYSLTIRGWQREVKYNLNSVTKGWARERSRDLSWYMKQGFEGQKDLEGRLKIFQRQQTDFKEIIKGHSTGNIRDLYNTIKSWVSVIEDFPEYIKATTQEIRDLKTRVNIWQHSYREINFMLHGWQTADLQLIIKSWHTEDLNALLRATYFSTIGAYLYAIQPVDIEASLRGWAIQDLQILLAKGEYAGDLPINIYGVPSVNLPITIDAKLGIQIIKDLNYQMTNLKVSDLTALMNIISYTDLNAYLLSSRLVADLQCMIYPKVVFVRQNLNVAFLEHRNLAAAINFTCVSSAFRELQFQLLAKHKADLPCRIYGGDGSNIVDLSFYINSYDYTTENTIQVNYLNIIPSTGVTIEYKKSALYSMNTVKVYGNSKVSKNQDDLTYMITGNMLYTDLGAFIHPYSNTHYPSKNVSTLFVALQLKKNAEVFRRYVELTFKSYVSQYYYFSGNQKAYRAYRNDHWVVQVEGNKRLPVGYGYEKIKVRRKYIFNLSKYESIDAALKDMIDRVTKLRSADLGVTITPYGAIYRDLSTTIMPSDLNGIAARRKFYTNRVLKGRILVTRPQDANLYAYIEPELLTATSDLNIVVTGADYNSPLEGIVDFNFTDSDILIKDTDNLDFEFIFGED